MPRASSQASETAFFHRARFMLLPSIATHERQRQGDVLADGLAAWDNWENGAAV